MCTISWLRSPGRLLLTMNRDERRLRAAESPPRMIRLQDGSSWLGPADGEEGGTWIGLHEAGWVACLTNRYPDPGAVSSEGSWPSRGEIVPRVMHFSDPEAARRGLESFPFGDYRPFTLLVASAASARQWSWNGDRLWRRQLPGPGWRMLTSSSWRPRQVARWRRERFRRWVQQGAPCEGGLPTFHSTQPEGRQTWAVLMDRPDTHTRSITQVRIEQGRGEMFYWYRPAGPAGEEPRQLEGPLEAGWRGQCHG